MRLKKWWCSAINQKADPNYIKHCFCIGWSAVLVSLAMDFLVQNCSGWFPRSGAILCMLSIAAEFRMNQLNKLALIRGSEEQIKAIYALDDNVPYESVYEKSVKLCAHLSIACGTVIWAYGDLLKI